MKSSDRQSVPLCGLGTQKDRFAVSEDGKAVCDSKTGLWWQQTPGDPPDANCGNSNSCTWQEARDYCANLDLHERRWRLAERGEYPIPKSEYFPRKPEIHPRPPREIPKNRILNNGPFTNVKAVYWAAPKGAVPVILDFNSYPILDPRDLERVGKKVWCVSGGRNADAP